MSQFLITDEELNDKRSVYRIHPPNVANWLVILVLAVLLNLTLVLRMGPGPGIAIILSVTVFGVIGWGKLGFPVMKRLTELALRQTLEGKIGFAGSLILSLMGMKLHNKGNSYFLEGYTQNLHFRGFSNVFSVIKTKFFDVLSACFGLTLLFLLTAGPVIVNGGSFINTFIIFLTISPFFVFWIIPLIWTAESSGLKEVDTTHRRSWDVYDGIKRGFLSRFIGFAGLITTISFIYANIEKLYLEFPGYQSSNQGPLQLLFFMLGLLILLFFVIGGIAIFIMAFYMQFYHPAVVNKYRKWLVQEMNIPVGISMVRVANPDETSFVKDLEINEMENIEAFFVYE